MRRIALLLGAAGAALALAACSSSSKDVSSGPTAKGASAATTTAPGTTSSTEGATTTVPDTTTTDAPLPADPAAAVQTYFARNGFTLDDAEAVCIADKAGDAGIAVLRSDGQNGNIGVPVFKALAACEPKAWIAGLTDSLTSIQGLSITADQATCVAHAADHLFVSDDAVAQLAVSSLDTKDWPKTQHDEFVDAAATCVPRDVALKIVDL